MTRIVRLREYQPKPGVRLSVGERDELVRLIPGLTTQPETGSTDTYTVTSGSTVGSVRLGDLIVELQPKIGPAAVLFLLSYNLDPRTWRAHISTLDATAPLTEAVAALFAQLVQSATSRGLARNYRQRDDTLSTIRGRIRIADQLRARSGLPLPTEVTYDDYTQDILENQILLSALDVLRRQRMRSAAVARTLTRLHGLFADVSLLAAPQHAPDPLWTRLNEHYRPAVALAKLILSNTGLEARMGDHAAKAVLINMNAVFEHFVRTALREALNLDRRNFPTPDGFARRDLVTSREVQLLPDLTWWDNGECIVVGDCKYKRPTGAVPNADVYQALAYMTEFQLDEAWLIYASGETKPRDLAVRHTPATIHIRTVDAALEPPDLLREIRKLAIELAGAAARARWSADVGEDMPSHPISPVDRTRLANARVYG